MVYHKDIKAAFGVHTPDSMNWAISDWLADPHNRKNADDRTLILRGIRGKHLKVNLDTISSFKGIWLQAGLNMPSITISLESSQPNQLTTIICDNARIDFADAARSSKPGISHLLLTSAEPLDGALQEMLDSIPDLMSGLRCLELRDMPLACLPDAWDRLAELRYVTAMNCGLVSIPDWIDTLAHLKYACFTGNLITRCDATFDHLLTRNDGVALLDGSSLPTFHPTVAAHQGWWENQPAYVFHQLNGHGYPVSAAVRHLHQSYSVLSGISFGERDCLNWQGRDHIPMFSRTPKEHARDTSAACFTAADG